MGARIGNGHSIPNGSLGWHNFFFCFPLARAFFFRDSKKKKFGGKKVSVLGTEYWWTFGGFFLVKIFFLHRVVHDFDQNL